MGSVLPTGEQLRLLDEGDQRTPIVMINLLRFRERAEYPDDFDAEPCSGREAYARYGAAAAGPLAKVGGTPIWGAEVLAEVIGPEGERWDQAFLVRYPSRGAFKAMATDPEYLGIVPHRTAALSDSRLIMCEAPDHAPEVFGVAEA